MATAGSNSDPLGSGEPSGPSFANNLTLLGYNENQANVAGSVGNADVTAASGNLSSAANYDSGILSGDRSQILSTEAPEISSLLSSYDKQRQAQGQLQPRGGGRSAFLNEQPYKEAGDVNKLIQSARPEAAKNLTQVGEAQSYLGESEQSLSQSAVSTSLSFLLGKSGVQLDSRKLQDAESQSLGESLGAALPQLLTLATAGAGA